jgi:hypothetical protein
VLVKRTLFLLNAAFAQTILNLISQGLDNYFKEIVSKFKQNNRENVIIGPVFIDFRSFEKVI